MEVRIVVVTTLALVACHHFRETDLFSGHSRRTIWFSPPLPSPLIVTAYTRQTNQTTRPSPILRSYLTGGDDGGASDGGGGGNMEVLRGQVSLLTNLCLHCFHQRVDLVQSSLFNF